MRTKHGHRRSAFNSTRTGHIRLVIGALLTGALVATAVLGPVLASADPYAIDLHRTLEGPSQYHLLGTDALGRDLLARTLHGARLAVIISILGVTLGSVMGVWLGLWAGYRGGWGERIAMRCVDVLLAFPGFLLALGAATALGPGTANLVIAVGFFSFPPFVRVARAMTVRLAKEEYVTAAKVLGAGDAWILTVHILRNAAGPLCALVSLRMAAAIATASGLSFLGLGPALPTPDWGSMLDTGREYLWLAPRLVVVPGTALFAGALGFYLLGDGLHDLLGHRLNAARI